MILLSTTRHFAETALLKFFPFINLQKKTRLNDVAHKSMMSREYLHAVVINCLLDEIEHAFKKKLVNTKGEKIKLQFTDAQGVLLYQVLMAMPVDSDKVYENNIRNHWVQELDKEIISRQIYHHNLPVKAIPPQTSITDYIQ